jgi:hypothetical protein
MADSYAGFVQRASRKGGRMGNRTAIHLMAEHGMSNADPSSVIEGKFGKLSGVSPLTL